MTAAADRDPAAIAREVTRKLIPGTLERHATIAGRMARRIAAANARETLARELAGIMGSSVWERRGDWQADIPGDIPGTTSPDGTVTRTVSGSFVPMYAGTDVTVELRGLTADHGRQLAELIASWRVTR
jgi:hypothetical protein